MADAMWHQCTQAKLFNNTFLSMQKSYQYFPTAKAKFYSHPANGIRTGDLEISTLCTSLLQSPALPTELSRVVSLSCQLVIAKHA